MNHSPSNEVLAAAPPLSVGTLTLLGVSLDQWVLVLTLIYTIFLIIDKAPAVLQRLRRLWELLRGKNGSN